MEVDKTTLDDLAIFNTEEELSIFNKINHSITSRGVEQLQRNISKPLSTANAIYDVQQTLMLLSRESKHWPKQISNGTIMMVERFFEANIETIPSRPSKISTLGYKLINTHDYSLVKYSITHCFDFIKGVLQLIEHFSKPGTPVLLESKLSDARKILDKPQLTLLKDFLKSGDIPSTQMLQLAHFLKYNYRHSLLELLHIFAHIDAWYGMAMAVVNLNLVYPEIIESSQPTLEVNGLYHLLLNNPVSYDVKLDDRTNFLFLTGANMAGKSTFIKAVGGAVFLAHTGMGVPAKKMRLSVFDGMLSNINVIDNIMKGESYFFNEVQRIKATVKKVSDGKKWLILIDELFKGTNVQDAMKCSTAVIEGFLKITDSLFILSTHLYEIGDELRRYPNISFNYFETAVIDDQLSFNYQLRKGISDDRLGYLILQKEGVVKMLEDL